MGKPLFFTTLVVRELDSLHPCEVHPFMVSAPEDLRKVGITLTAYSELLADEDFASIIRQLEELDGDMPTTCSQFAALAEVFNDRVECCEDMLRYAYTIGELFPQGTIIEITPHEVGFNGQG